jgi:hypothetical protein
MRKRFEFISLVFALVLGLGVSAFGQERTGNLEGTVKDPTGAVVPNVSVTIKNAATTASETTTTGHKYGV